MTKELDSNDEYKLLENVKSVFPNKGFVELDEVGMNMFLLLTLAPHTVENVAKDFEKIQIPSFLIIKKRVEVFKLNVPLNLMIFGASITKNPGEIVMFLIDCLEAFDGKPTLENVCTYLYPEGFFSEEASQANWIWLKDNFESLKYGYLIGTH